VPLSYNTFLKQLRGLTSSDHDAYFAYIGNRYGFVPTEQVGTSDET
jgi:hypothetical protein